MFRKREIERVRKMERMPLCVDGYMYDFKVLRCKMRHQITVALRCILTIHGFLMLKLN